MSDISVLLHKNRMKTDLARKLMSFDNRPVIAGLGIGWYEFTIKKEDYLVLRLTVEDLHHVCIDKKMLLGG